MTREAAVLAMVGVALLILLAMLWGWRRRGRRDAGLQAPLGEIPDNFRFFAGGGGSVRGYVGGLTNLLTIIISVGVMLTIDWSLTLLVLVIFSLALVPVNMIGRKLRRIANRTQRQIGRMTSEITEGLSGIRMAA